MPQRGSTSVTLPVALFNRIRDLIKRRPDLAFSTPTEYIRDAIRRALERDEEE